MSFEIQFSTDIYREELEAMEKYGQIVTEKQDEEGRTVFYVGDKKVVTVDFKKKYVRAHYGRYSWSSGEAEVIEYQEASNPLLPPEARTRRFKAWFGEFKDVVTDDINATLKDHFINTYLKLPPGTKISITRAKIDTWHSVFAKLGEAARRQIPFERFVFWEPLRLCRDTFRLNERDYRPKLGDYCFFWANLEDIKEIERKAPALLAFIWTWYHNGKNPDGTHRQGLDAEQKAARVDNLMGVLREWLMTKYDLSKGDWKALTTLTAQQGKWLWRDTKNIGMDIAIGLIKEGHKFPKVTAMQAIENFLLNNRDALRRMKERCYRNGDPVIDPKTGVQALNHEGQPVFQRIYDPNLNLLKSMIIAGLAAAGEARNVKIWVSTEWEQVIDWFLARGHTIVPDKNQLKPTRTIEIVDPVTGQKTKKIVNAWRFYVRQSEAWHEEVVQETEITPEIKAATWETYIEPHVEDGFQWVPLRNGAELVHEGRIMHHCVGNGTYTASSREGRSLIFSIRDLEGNRLATFQINAPTGGFNQRENKYIYETNKDGSPKQWTFGQMRGKRNCDMDELLRKPCQRFLDRFNGHLRAAWEETQKVEKEAKKEAKKAAQEEIKQLKAKLKKAPERDAKRASDYAERLAQGDYIDPPEYEVPALQARIAELEEAWGLGMKLKKPKQQPSDQPELPLQAELPPPVAPPAPEGEQHAAVA